MLCAFFVFNRSKLHYQEHATAECSGHCYSTVTHCTCCCAWNCVFVWRTIRRRSFRQSECHQPISRWMTKCGSFSSLVLPLQLQWLLVCGCKFSVYFIPSIKTRSTWYGTFNTLHLWSSYAWPAIKLHMYWMVSHKDCNFSVWLVLASGTLYLNTYITRSF